MRPYDSVFILSCPKGTRRRSRAVTSSRFHGFHYIQSGTPIRLRLNATVRSAAPSTLGRATSATINRAGCRETIHPTRAVQLSFNAVFGPVPSEIIRQGGRETPQNFHSRSIKLLQRGSRALMDSLIKLFSRLNRERVLTRHADQLRIPITPNIFSFARSTIDFHFSSCQPPNSGGGDLYAST